jgi:2-iminobutanoate/2-iminopropanoate deaminase
MSGQCPREQEMSMAAPHFSLFTEAVPLVFISGQLPFDASGQIPHAEVAQQTTQALQNLAAVVAKAGLGLQNIVKTTVWLRREADFAAFNESYAQFFGELRPARSTVIGALVHPAALVEIEAVAWRQGGGSGEMIYR